MKRLILVFALMWAAVFGGGGGLACGSSKSSGSGAPAKLDDNLPASCSPLRVKGACMLPYPNAIYLNPDPTAKTGFRVALPNDALPASGVSNVPLDVAPYNAADGFSPATPILAYFPEKIDVASLVAPQDAGKSLDPSAATLLVDMTTNKLVPHFSELDQTASQDFDRQAIMIRPLQRLAPNHRYAVAITTAIKTADGKSPAPPPLFASIASGNPPDDPMAKKQAARMPEILASLAAAGVAKDKLLVAWDLVTGTDEYLTSHVLAMRDVAVAEVGADGLGYTITNIEENPTPQILRRLTGTYTVPHFLTSTDAKKAETHLVLDAQGKPQRQGTYQAPFTLIIPKSAETKAPLPLVLNGHGLLGRGADVSDLAQNANDKGYVMFGTDWIGLSTNEDPAASGGNGAAGEALTDINRIGYVTDRLQQSIINAMVLARTVRGKMSQDAAMTVTGKAGGTPAADPTRLTYYGISLGGIMGGSLMGYSPDITRGVLGVPAGFWSFMFQRSSDWPRFKLLIAGAYHDYLDQQLLLALIQMRFDFSDPATVAPHSISDPLPGVPKKQILIQMSLNDSQVPNLATYEISRTLGVQLLQPSVIDVYGLPQTAGPLASALTTWDSKLQPFPPLTNATPEKDNGAHGAIRKLPEAQNQIDHFFTTGEVIATCGGPCVSK